MAQLAADISRKYKVSPDIRAEQPVDATTTIYAGSAVGFNGTTKYARQLVAADAFLGFAHAKAANVVDPTKPGLTINGVALGSAAAINVEVRTSGILVVPLASVAGGVGTTDTGANVYMSDGNTLTLTSTSNTKIGTVRNYLNGNYEIFFQAATDHL